MAERQSNAGAVAAGDASLAELDRVATLVTIDVGGGRVLPAGAEGTVVGVWGRGAAFEVEFARPLDVLVTVQPFQIGRIAHAR